MGSFPRKKRSPLPANSLRVGSFLLPILSISFAMVGPANGEYPRSKHGPGVGILLALGAAGIAMGMSGWTSRMGREVSGSSHPLGSLGVHQVWGLA